MTNMTDHEYRELLYEIDEEGEELTDWEINFVEDLMRKADNSKYKFSDKQKGQILRIHKERVE